MDPISIGTTIASLVKTFTTGAQTCNALLSKYKHAPQTLASIHTECTTIKLALSHVYWLVNSDSELLSSQLDAQGPLAETFDVALTGCTVAFSLLDVELQKLCQQSKEKESFSTKERIRFVWNEDLARSLLDDMRGLQGAVTLLLTALQTSSLAALNRTIAQQRPVIERVRQSTNSVCQGISQTSQEGNEIFDTYSIFSSTIGDEEFAFDNEVINSKVYRRVLNKAINAQVLRNADTGHKPELLDEPLIDLSDEPKGLSVPHLDGFGAGSRWFGSFDGALPADGDSAFLGPGNDRAQESTSLVDTLSTQRSENGPISDRRSVKSRFAEPSVAENSPFQACKAFDTRAVACRTEQETRREQYSNEVNSGGEGDGYEADSEIVPNKKLAQGGTNQEGEFAGFRQHMMEVDVEQPPDLPDMQTTLQQFMIPEIPPPSPDARVSESSNLSKATITTDDTNTSVPGNTTIEHAYEIAPSSSLIGPTTPLPFYNDAPFSFETAPDRIFGVPARKSSDDRLQADEDPYPLPPTINMEEAAVEIPGTPEEEKYIGILTPAPDEPPTISPYIGAAANIGSDSDDDSSFQLTPIASTTAQEQGTWYGAVGKHPTIIRQGPGSRAKSREGLLNDFQNTEESEESSPVGDLPVSHEYFPTIQRATSVVGRTGKVQRVFRSFGRAESVLLPGIERSRLEGHHFILSALVWLVDPDSYTIKDSVVSNSILEISITLLGTVCGKTSAFKTYAAQNPNIMNYNAITAIDSYKIRVPIIINRYGCTQESFVTLMDVGANYHHPYSRGCWSDADVVVLCYPVEGKMGGWIEDVNEYWCPVIREHYHKVPVILVGMKTDKRETARSDDLYYYYEGLACARTNNVAAYVECSSTSLGSIN
ncbi:hypothetical protein JMJ35_003984 [Cladonia borealis]|uniref:Fungal N-terminal domain-containing protein n=1 Tax=Cladonia borealis TaxID=184061 RepID=A0AA39R4D7_9LECA|nr:hypothetical protein JMJ35_003984 [Cladonia borealis]